MAVWMGLVCSLVLNAAPAAGTWDFEKPLAGWEQPGSAGSVIAESDRPKNHVYQIAAAAPHHTRLTLQGSEATPDFVAELRVRVVSSQGEPPVVYVYGRSDKDGFRGLALRGSQASLFCYFGQAAPGQTLDSARPAVFGAGPDWLRVKLACHGSRMFGKIWADGAPEPRWQMHGEADGHARGRFALGVWTSPRAPSTARVWFDDVSFQPLDVATLRELSEQTQPRAALDVKTLPAQSGRFDTADAVGLVAGDTVVTFDRHSGEITHLIDRRSGQEFADPTQRRALFTITLGAVDREQAIETSAADFRKVRITAADQRQVRLSFAEHVGLPLTVETQATAGDDGLVRMRIAVRNRSPLCVREIRFPQVAAPAVLGKEADDDRLLIPLPLSDGAVIEQPGSRSRVQQSLYPQGAFTQFAAYYDARAGLYLGAEDPDGHCKRWDLRCVARTSVEFPLAHLTPEIPDRDVIVPYDIVLGTFHGDWRDAADIYKRWARRQAWCSKTLIERGDIPQFLKEGAGVMIAGIQNAKGYNGLLGEHLQGLPELMTAYKARTGLKHLIFVPYGWENRGTWAGINYFPAVPSNADWQTANAALRAQGDRTALLTSGFWWVVKRRESNNGPAFDDAADYQQRQVMVVRNRDGRAFAVDNFEQTNSRMDWRGLSVELCHGSAEARQTLRQVFLEAVRLGAPLVSFDQEIGGGQHTPCYSQEHGHAPGYGNWMWTDFRDLCREILQQGKSVAPELGLLMENTSELAIPYMATYWSRQFGEFDLGGAGGRGVGLFSYLYHEYVTAIGAACVQGQGMLGTQPAAELRAYVLANNLTRGLIPGPFMQDVPLTPKDAWHAQVSRAYCAFCQPYARFPEYLVLGVTKRPPTVACATQEVWYWRQDSAGKELKSGGPKVSKVTATLPTVTAGAFTAADGSLGMIVVNTTERAQKATVRPTATGRPAVLYRADRSVVERWAAVPAALDLELEPLGTRILVVQ